jgi:hypothetical protein
MIRANGKRVKQIRGGIFEKKEEEGCGEYKQFYALLNKFFSYPPASIAVS